ncbi:MAG: hypothetical protein NW237_12605 [Cyanobacteriota bacterium]|nr:hypothetical protein [Cyanobacteriota bacterium]
MKAHTRRLAIAQEWMINPESPNQTISRLKSRATYSDVTLWWLVVQLDLLDKSASSQFRHG